jgi:hypothetical protein
LVAGGIRAPIGVYVSFAGGTFPPHPGSKYPRQESPRKAGVLKWQKD